MELLRRVLNDGQSIGEVRRIASAFSFHQSPEFFSDNIRTHSGLEPFGCVGDLGWYCLRFTLWVMQGQMPIQVTGRLLSEHHRADSPAAVPTAFSGELLFAAGVSASFYCSFLTETEQWARISGTRGCLQLSDFVLPVAGSELGFEVYHSEFQVNGCDFRMDMQARRFTVSESSHGHANAQESNMFRNFSAQVLSGQLNPTWPEIALNTQAVVQACLESAHASGTTVPVG